MTFKEEHFMINNDYNEYNEGGIAMPHTVYGSDIIKVEEKTIMNDDIIDEHKSEDDASTIAGGWRGPKKQPVPIGTLNLKTEFLPTFTSEREQEEFDENEMPLQKKIISSFDIEVP
jgi:hypothetical protein